MFDPYETTSVGGFVQQLAAHCLPHGYRYYVSGLLPEGKDYRAIDARIITKYDIPANKWERYRRKKAGEVNLRYLRHGRQFLLIATGPWGQHPFFESEVEIRDVHEVPIRFHGYALSYRGGRVWVRIGREELKAIRKRLLWMARRARASRLAAEFKAIPYQPYRSVRYQLLRLLEAVNKRRKVVRLRPVPESAIPERRINCCVFKKAECKSQTMGEECTEKKHEQATHTAEVGALG